ncbi:thiol-specific antioxidant protein [Deinococcus aerius]|uniref:Thiol-specific antioxidant protein n=1 Tax=Deinococcus aerius TaxID=200253 RepID=A0A2I9DF93_9DEIO|nr:thiol-specific antioxidant protein [Deinococcus aerius]
MPTVSVPALFAVQQAAQQSGRKVLTLAFEDAQLDTVIYTDGPKILTIRNSMAPMWSTLLLRAGVPSRALAEARQRNATLSKAVQDLVDAGNLPVGDAARLAHERLMSALVPLYWHLATAEIRSDDFDDPKDFVAHTDAPSALTEAGWYALTMKADQRAFLPSDRFKTPLVRLIEHSHTPLGLIWNGLRRGSSLGEIARRLPFRWDTLTGHVAELIAREVLKSWAEARSSSTEGRGD